MSFVDARAFLGKPIGRHFACKSGRALKVTGYYIAIRIFRYSVTYLQSVRLDAVGMPWELMLCYIHHTYLTHRSISQRANLAMKLLLLSPKNVSLNIFCSVAQIYSTKTLKERAVGLSDIGCVYLVFI